MHYQPGQDQYALGGVAVWCGVVRCGVVWCGVVVCGVMWCDLMWWGAVRRVVVWCGVVWCVGGDVYISTVVKRYCELGEEIVWRIIQAGVGTV